MSFANPWGLLALLALPVIVAIHLYHRRFPPLVVAGTHLWGLESELRSAGRRLDRLPISATLLLELLAALLLALILSDPRIGEMGKATHLIVVLDNSASMQSQPAGEPSFSDEVLAQLDQRMGEAEHGSVVTIMLTGRRPVMLAGPAVPWDEARPLVAAWRPAAPRHDFQPAWDRAAQFAESGGQLLFLTDTPLDGRASASSGSAAAAHLPQEMEVVAVGQPLDNVAITAARWTFDSAVGRGTIFLRVENLGRGHASVTVTGSAGDRAVFAKSLSLAAGDGVPLEAEVPGGLGELVVTAEVQPGDPLPIDNRVTLVEPKVRMVTIANRLPTEDAAGRAVRRVLDSLPDLQEGDDAQAHLLIGPAGELPASRADLWWLGVGPVDPSEEAAAAAVDLAGPYLIEKQHPLLEGVTLGGVVWGGGQELHLDLAPLVSAGRFVLLGRLEGTRTTGYLLNVDLTRSNLADSPDWPILLSNLVELRRDALPGLRRWNYRLNERIEFRLFETEPEQAVTDAPAHLRLLHGDDERTLARAPLVELPPLDETGIYELWDGDREVGRFAVNFFDTDESRLTELGSGHRRAVLPEDTHVFRLDRPYSWLILLGLLVVLAALLLNWRVVRTR